MNMQRVGEVARQGMSLIAILTGVLILAALVLQKGRTEMTVDFFVLYAIGAGLSIGLGIAVFFADFIVKRSGTKNLIGRSFFIVDRSFLRPGSLFIAIPIIIFVVISLFVGGVVMSGQTGQPDGRIFATPNPYGETFTYQEGVTLSEEQFVSNMFLGAVVPGWVEDALIFFAWQATTAILMILFAWTMGFRKGSMENPVAWWIFALVSITVWSGLFSIAHGRYGGNVEAYLFAFGFEWIMQVLNAFTGFFGSWLPHMVHNAGVIANKTFSVVLASFLFLPSKKLARWI